MEGSGREREDERGVRREEGGGGGEEEVRKGGVGTGRQVRGEERGGAENAGYNEGRECAESRERNLIIVHNYQRLGLYHVSERI